MTETRLAKQQQCGTPIVLASASAARAAMLRAVGIAFVSEAAAIDESQLKASLRAEAVAASAAATTLAELKATRVSLGHPDTLVIGADQILDCDGRWFDKPVDAAQARADLTALRGRDHTQFSAVCVVYNGALLWHHVGAARLVMRDFSDAFLDAYLAQAGAAVYDCAGGYQLEGLGAHLFSRIEGDYFTILGLPLLALLGFLRDHGVLER